MRTPCCAAFSWEFEQKREQTAAQVDAERQELQARKQALEAEMAALRAERKGLERKAQEMAARKRALEQQQQRTDAESQSVHGDWDAQKVGSYTVKGNSLSERGL